jgi:hypothetical protein
MSVAMLTTAGSILDVIGVPSGMGTERVNAKESEKNSFDDMLRLKYLNDITGHGTLELGNIELRKFTIFGDDGNAICLARILSIKRNTEISTLRVIMGQDDSEWYTVSSLKEDRNNDISWKEIYYLFEIGFQLDSIKTAAGILSLSTTVKLKKYGPERKKGTLVSVELIKLNNGITWDTVLQKQCLLDRIDSFYKSFGGFPGRVPDGYPEFNAECIKLTISSQLRDILLIGELVLIEGVHCIEACRLYIQPQLIHFSTQPRTRG